MPRVPPSSTTLLCNSSLLWAEAIHLDYFFSQQSMAGRDWEVSVWVRDEMTDCNGA